MLEVSLTQLAELHDGRLVGISYKADASIRLDFETDKATKISFLLKGFVNFFCKGMLEGNIVQSVEIINSGDVSDSDLTYFVHNEGRGQTAERLREKLQRDHLMMFLLTPSYGAELACVCSEVERHLGSE